ncbi:MAG: hypothetical protein J5J00_08190 [Deltaproteobacteria bacterium]|nr:hypothetical protein [Deltaproteobacteria bacterium]
MKSLCSLLLKKFIAVPLLLLPVSAFADDAAQKFDLSPWEPSSISFQVSGPEEAKHWSFKNSTDSPASLTILIVDKPEVRSSSYKLSGKIKYRDVEGSSHLEMWSYFSGGRQFFTRTVAETGGLQKISGDSDWRDIELPFFAAEGELPEKLAVNLVMAGKGEVSISPLELSAISPNAGSAPSQQPDSPGQWFSTKAAIYFGSYGGAALGVFCALIGTLAGMGKGRGFVLAAMKTLIALGTLLSIAGLLAVFSSQPYAVYYPLLLIGGLLIIIIPSALGTVSRRYQEDELRKISSMDMGAR